MIWYHQITVQQLYDTSKTDFCYTDHIMVQNFYHQFPFWRSILFLHTNVWSIRWKLPFYYALIKTIFLKYRLEIKPPELPPLNRGGCIECGGSAFNHFKNVGSSKISSILLKRRYKIIQSVLLSLILFKKVCL